MKYFFVLIGITAISFARAQVKVKIGAPVARYEGVDQLNTLYKQYGTMIIVENDVYKMPCDCYCRNMGGDSENRNLGGNTEGRNRGGKTEGRGLGGSIASRKLGGDTETRALGGGMEGRNLGGKSENRNMGGQTGSFSCFKNKAGDFFFSGINPNTKILWFDGLHLEEIPSNKIKP